MVNRLLVTRSFVFNYVEKKATLVNKVAFFIISQVLILKDNTIAVVLGGPRYPRHY